MSTRGRKAVQRVVSENYNSQQPSEYTALSEQMVRSSGCWGLQFGRGPSPGGRRTLSQLQITRGAGSFPPCSVSMVMVQAKAWDLAAVGALFPLSPLHHLFHLHTWPRAAATASARGEGFCHHRVALLDSIAGYSSLKPRSSAPATSSSGTQGVLKQRQN